MSIASPSSTTMRADARRNYGRLLAAAKAALEENGSNASLDDIARRAGVGVGTLYRHFPTRQALYEDVIEEQLRALTEEAGRLLTSPEPVDAFAGWLRAMTGHAWSYRGLAAALMIELIDREPGGSPVCDALHAAGGALLERARASAGVGSNLDIADLVKLANAIGVATEMSEERDAEADRLLAVVIAGAFGSLQTRVDRAGAGRA